MLSQNAPMPTILPIIAPNKRDGMKRPAGTFIPKVNTVRASFKKNVNINKPIALYTPGPSWVTSIDDDAFVMFIRE